MVSREPDGAPLHDTWPLIGRDTEVARTVAALTSGTRSALIYGPSGVGKSRLAASVGSDLEAAGWLVLTATGNPALSAVPFATFAPAIARGIAQPSVPTSADPLALFTMAHAAVSDLAKGRAALLIVDDITSADSVSITLIAQLVAAGALRVIATVQEGQPVPDGALPLASGPESLRVDLSPLDVDTLGELLAVVLSRRVAHRTVAQLHAASHGNPLFVRELVLGALESGNLHQSDGHWQLARAPEGTPALRDLILARTRNLDPEQRDVLERLAVCQTLEIGEFTRPDAATALAELESRGMIRVDESGHGVAITLAHPHYAAAVRASLPRIRAIALLIEQADIVSSRTMHAADELRVALWRLDAGRPADPDLLLRSATLARSAGDHRTSARLVAAAIDSGADDAASHLLHAELLWSLGRGEESLAALERAEECARRSGTADPILVAIASKRAEVYGGDPLGSERGIRLLDEIGLAAPEQRPRLLLVKATLVLHLLRAHEAIELVEEAGALMGDHPRAVVDVASVTPLTYLQRTDEAIAAARRALAHASAPGSAFPARQAAVVLAGALFETDEYEPARQAVISALRDAIRDDDQFTTRVAEFFMARVFWARGRLDTATRWLRDTVSGAELHGPASLRSPALGLQAVIACEQGDLARAEELRARMDERYDQKDPLTALAGAWIAQLNGSTDEAAGILIAGADQAIPLGSFGVAAGFLHTLARLGSPGLARDAAARLDAVNALAPNPRIARRAAHAHAEATADAEALRRIGAEWERLGAVLHAAECFASAGRAAHAQGRGRDAASDLQRSAALVAATEGARTPLLQFADGPEPLTPREREIASLAAQGLSSNEIAQRLFLSPRTVNNHLQSTYTKLGIRGRHELSV